MEIERLGADGSESGLYVRFETGMGTNVYLGFRYKHQDAAWGDPPHDHEKMAMSLPGWERLCELVDEYRERNSQTPSI